MGSKHGQFFLPPQSKHLSELSSSPANFCSSTGPPSLWLCLAPLLLLPSRFHFFRTLALTPLPNRSSFRCILSVRKYLLILSTSLATSLVYVSAISRSTL